MVSNLTMKLMPSSMKHGDNRMNIVLDTNILVSAVWSPGRNATDILCAAFAGRFNICYDHRIIDEYIRVLHYPKLKFEEWEINSILEPLIKNGISVIAPPITDITFDRDEDDKKFYEVAKYCNAVLITGNLRHFPDEPDIMSPADFCQKYL